MPGGGINGGGGGIIPGGGGGMPDPDGGSIPGGGAIGGPEGAEYMTNELHLFRECFNNQDTKIIFN